VDDEGEQEGVQPARGRQRGRAQRGLVVDVASDRDALPEPSADLEAEAEVEVKDGSSQSEEKEEEEDHGSYYWDEGREKTLPSVYEYLAWPASMLQAL